MIRNAACIAVAALALACASGPKPAMKQRTDGLLAGAASSRSVAGFGGAFAPKAWKPGQWVLVATRYKGEPSVLKMSVVDKDDRGVWLEYDVQDYRQRSITKVLYTRQPTTPDEAFDLLQVIITRKDGEKAQELDFADPKNPMAGLMKGMAKGMMKGFQTNLEELKSLGRQDVTVRAGTFRGCAGYSMKGPDGKEHRGFIHGGVPINGLVKGETTDGEVSTELIDFGETGATSAL
jgi:hypothetical protein